MVKTFKLKRFDYSCEQELLEHLNTLLESFRQVSNELVVESTYRCGELDHVFILMNVK